MPTVKYLFISVSLIYLCLSGIVCRPVKAVRDIFNKAPEVEAVSEVLKTTIPLGYAASLAMDAIAGDTGSMVTILTGFSQFPGNGVMSIAVNGTYPLPIGSDTSGTIIVAGFWSSADQAILSVFFTDLSISQGTFTLENVATFPVMRDTSFIRIVYSSQDVNSDSDTSLIISLTPDELQFEWTKYDTEEPIDSNISIDQDAWIITVDSKGTSDVPEDDIYTLAGAGQYASAGTGSASVVQLVMIGTAYTPAKRLNPYEGRGILRDIDVSAGSFPELGTAVLTFHSQNDGRVDVTVATGVYIGQTGKTLALHLDQ